MKKIHTTYMSFALSALKEFATVICLLFVLGVGNVWGDETFELVTNASNLSADDEIIILSSNGSYALSTNQRNANREAVAPAANNWSISGTTVTLYASTTVQVITLEVYHDDEDDEDYWEFNVGGTNKYLYASSNSSNELKSRSSNASDYNGDWTIEIDNSNVATVQTVGANSRRRMRCNTGNNPVIFACYSTTSTTGTLVKIYKKSTAACSADPSTGNASINSSFTLTSLTDAVTVSSGTWGTGSSDCAWIDYGFVWSDGTTTTSPTTSNNKVQVGTSGKATSWATDATHKVQPSGSTSPTAWVVGKTYYVKAYGKNGKDGAAFAYSTTAAYFTLRSIDFEENGGSTVNMIYANSGGTATKPIDPTKTGYTFGGWYKEVGLSNAVTWASDAISENKTYYAKWSAKTYAITLNGNGGTGSSPASVNATYNAHALSAAITNPEKTDYIFEGWNTKADGSGLTVIGTNGELISSVSGYTDASGNWTKDGTETLYAKWTEHTYTNYRTSCCTELGTIDGEASLTQAGNSVTISGWSDVSNVGTYTVKLYKKNGASWDLVSGTTSGGSAGAQGTRTGITSGSKSVTYTGLEVESEYKFTVQAIAGSAAYCDGVETAITTINSKDVSSTPFKFRYSIYIDNGSGSGWAHHYITPTGNTDEGSVAIDLSAHVTSYQFKIFGGFSGNWGQSTNDGVIPANTKWTLNGSFNVKLNSGAGGSYTFTVDYSSTDPAVTVTFPSADQASGYKIYFDKSVIDGWGNTLKYRIGNNSHNQNQNFSPVTGTDNFYVTTTPNYGSMDAWQIANNVAWVPGNDGEYNAEHGIYNYYHNGDANNITKATVYFDYAVDEDITIVPTTKKNTENSCDFWYVDKTSGMLTHNVSLNSPAHGTLLATYTNTSGTTGQTVTEGNNADLAHRCILTITATPDDGYTCTSLTVNSSNFTSGNTHILSADAVVEATFTAKTCTVNFDKNSGSGGDASTTATYGLALPTVSVPSRTGYTFDGYWDAETNNNGSGTQYYSANGICARNWDKDVTADQTLYAKWNAKQCTITFDKNGGSGGDNNVTATYDQTMTTVTPPTRSGYTFDGYWDEETEDDGSGNKYYNADGTSAATWNKDVTAAQTLYAKWNAKTDTYKSEMHTGVTAWSSYASGVTKNGAGYTIPNPGDIAVGDRGTDCEGKHYHFAGWVTDANKEAGTISGNIIAATGTTDATGTTYWAVWEKEKAGSVDGYLLVEDDDDLSAGDKILIASAKETSANVLGYQKSGQKGQTNRGYASSVSITSKVMTPTIATSNSETSYAFEIELQGTSDGWYFYDAVNSGYLQANGGTSENYLTYHTGSSHDNHDTWTISVADETSVATIQTLAGTTSSNKGWMRWNGNNSLFSCYNSGQSDVYVFRYAKEYEDPKVECVCSANPSAGTAAVDAEGTFSASRIDVKATSASTGHADCSYSDYGFVWSTSVTTPTLVEGTGAASTNCTKVPVGTSGEVTSFTGSLTGSFTTSPIYLRSYAKNDNASGTYQYSSVVTITPRSVTFNLNGHGSSAPAAQLVNNGSKAADPSYSESVTGYIFGGWYKEAGCSNAWNFASDVVSGENKTLYAKWTPITYSVRFNDNDENYLGTATGSMSNESYDYDESKALTDIGFELAGYDFAGWALTADGSVAHADGASVSNLSSTNGATVDLYAIWTAKSYDVTLAATDETSSVGSQIVTATYNAAMPTTKKGSGAVAAPSRTGYTFTGWEYSSTTYYNYNAGTSTLTSAHVWDQPNSTTTLTPKWSINSYTLTWNLDGGTVATAGTGANAGATGTPSSSVQYNSAITVPTITKAGYNFAGWDVTPASNMPASNTTYTATWTAKTLNSISLAEASVSVYVGEIKYVDVIYNPSDILTKGFTQVATPSYCQIGTYASNMQAKITGGRAGATITEDKTETVSIKANADNEKTASITVTVKPLPLVHFVDNIHNESFADVVATIDANTLNPNKSTPTHADVAEPGEGNSCEKTHLHLIGWIRSDYSKVANYMNGTGAAPTTDELKTAGTGYWFAPGADINVLTYDGKIFYAVWAVEE